jgi:hypothetical protein
MMRRLRVRQPWSLALSAFVALASCAHERRGIPLYAGAAPPRPRSEVALLYGPITFVDGERVAGKGDTFELLPGCHVVQIGGQTGNFGPLQQSGWITTLRPLTFAFRMTAGGTYAINLDMDPTLGLGPNGTAHVVARAQDAHGGITVVPTARARADVDACRQWRPDGTLPAADARAQGPSRSAVNTKALAATLIPREVDARGQSQMAAAQFRMGDSSRGSEHGAHLAADGLRVVGARARQEFERQRDQLQRRAKLREQALAPIGRLFDDSHSQRALRDLRTQTLEQMNVERASLLAARERPGATAKTFAGGSYMGSPVPFDGDWKDELGGGLATASKDTGIVNASIGVTGGESQYCAGGILVWVVPPCDGDVLYLSANLSLRYNWFVETTGGPTAHTDGNVNLLVRAHDERGRVIDGLTEDRRESLWSASSSGLDDSRRGLNELAREPVAVLRGGAFYEVWFWGQSSGDSGESPWGGWSASYGLLSMHLERVGITEMG